MRAPTLRSVLVAGLLASAGSAGAQVAAPAPSSPPAERVDPNATGTAGTLSDRLSRTDGVIAPPANPSGMVVPAPVPDPGTTPVIRPEAPAPGATPVVPNR